MSRKRPSHLQIVPAIGLHPTHGRVFMALDEDGARREASHWYVRLREEDDDDAVKGELAEWLRASPLHGDAWISMCETMETVDRAPDEWRSYSLSGQSRHNSRGFRAGGGASQKRKRHARVGVGAIAAACAFAFALPTISLRLQADHVTSTGHVEQVRLADGSTVQIAPDSAIAVDYRDGRRTVHLLSGQAMFDVTHDPSRPFRVEAGNVTTTVLGTSFDVRRLGDMTSVAVARGHVRVENKALKPIVSRDLLPGDWVRIDPGHAAETGKVTPQLIGGWRNGEALAENRTIGSVIDEIRPWFRGRIFLRDAHLANRRVTGIYNVKEPAKALEMIIRPYGGRITHVTPWVLIVSAT